MRTLAAVAGLLLLACAALAPLEPDPLATREDLPAPAILRSGDAELREVPLVWHPARSEEVAGYLVERADPGSPDFERRAVVKGRFTTSWVDRGPLEDAAAYRYRVRSVARDGSVGVPVSPVSRAVTAGPPASPRGLDAISQLPRRVALQWRASTDPRVVGYVVERAIDAEGPFQVVAEPGDRFDTVWIDRGLGDLRVFYYRVAARNRAGVLGTPSRVVQAVTKAEPLPPLGLRVAEKRLGHNRLAWEANVEEDVAGYRLLRQRADGGASKVVAALPPDAVEAQDDGVAADEVITYQLVAFDADGLASAPSEPIEVRSEGYALEAQPRSGAIALRWHARSGEGFAAARIYRHGLVTRREVGRVTGSEFVDSGVEPGGTYRYSVVLERADGTRAPPSAVVEVTLPGEATASPR